MNPFNIGRALGILQSRGSVTIQVEGEDDWYVIYVSLDDEDRPTLLLDDAVLLLQAKRVRR